MKRRFNPDYRSIVIKVTNLKVKMPYLPECFGSIGIGITLIV